MNFIKDVIKNRYIYLMAAPGLIASVIIAYIPMFGHLIAFKDYKVGLGILGSKWVGFENFRFFFSSNDWLRITFNTIFLNCLFLFFNIVTALIIAVFLNEITNAVFKKTAQSVIFLPYFVSWMVVSLMIQVLLRTDTGLINRMLESIGLNAVNWYQSPGVWPIILTIINVWKFSGYNSIIFLASIVSISGEYYESAKIDGATKLQQLFWITIPLLKKIVIVLLLLGIGRIFFGDFGMIYGIIGDNSLLFSTTDVIDTYSFRALRQLGNFSMSAAIVFYQSVMGLIMIVIFNSIIKKVDRDSVIF